MSMDRMPRLRENPLRQRQLQVDITRFILQNPNECNHISALTKNQQNPTPGGRQ